MSWWKLKKTEQIVVHQTRPLVFRREDDRWVLEGIKEIPREKNFSLSDDFEEEPGYS